jgi:hypothetical protein
MLERLPNELLSFIFRLACKDGGKTAGTLRLLSRRIKAVAAPHRFRTVAVAGADAIVALVATLGRIPPELRVIEHMFLAPYTASELSTYERRPARSLQDEEQEIVTGWAPLRALVSYASPHVRNLALLAFNDIDCIGAFAGIPLLHLQVLTIDVSDDASLAGQLILPRVRTINISVSRKFGGIHGANILMRILRPWPALERVHLYGAEARRDLSYLATKVVKDLPRLVRCDVHPLVPTMDPGTTLADLKEIIEHLHCQDIVHFHEPQRGQFRHYSVWKSLWAESVQM